MGKALVIFLMSLALQTLAAPPPPLITFDKAGEVGVNFGGYHASAGLGGLLSGGGVGGLHAEAGTPHGQAAKAGLGGSFGDAGSQGGLYAGATAGAGTQAAAGLEGQTGAKGSTGQAFAAAQAGSRGSSAGLEGDTSAVGSGGLSFTAHKSFNNGGAVVKEVEVEPVVADNAVLPDQTFDVIKHKKKVISYEGSVNYQAPPSVVKVVEFQPAPVIVKQVDVKTDDQVPVVYKEVRIHKPHHHKPHHFKTWAGAGGFFEAGLGAPASTAVEATKVQVKEVQAPVIQKRVDVAAESSANAAVGVQPAQVGYTKTLTFAQRNPNFFADIFNIPIQTLSAVGKLLGNAASGTSVSVQKSAYAHADSHKYIGSRQ